MLIEKICRSQVGGQVTTMAGCRYRIDRRIAIGFAQFGVGWAVLKQGSRREVAHPRILSPSGLEAESTRLLRLEAARCRCCGRIAAAAAEKETEKMHC